MKSHLGACFRSIPIPKLLEPDKQQFPSLPIFLRSNQKDGRNAGVTVVSGQKFLILTVDRPMTPALKAAMVQTMMQILSRL